jgi:coproporphyrinogen III oxidase
MQDWFNFVSEVGDSFLEAYVPIVEREKDAYHLNIKHGRKYVVVVM